MTLPDSEGSPPGGIDCGMGNPDLPAPRIENQHRTRQEIRGIRKALGG